MRDKVIALILCAILFAAAAILSGAAGVLLVLAGIQNSVGLLIFALLFGGLGVSGFSRSNSNEKDYHTAKAALKALDNEAETAAQSSE